jgi:hypothetical protein
MYVHVTTYRVKDTTAGQAAQLWHEFDKYLEGTGVKMRLFSSHTGERPVFMIVTESESLDAMYSIKGMPPEEFAAWHAKWAEVRLPNSRHDQIWQER